MANTRIKDISTAATTLNSDDYIAVDGSTAGTRKIAKADLISEVSTGVSGTYLEESNNLSDVASKDTSKLNLEVPDVGTGPQEVPLNSMLSSMAYQSADSVSVAELQVESTTGTGTTQALTVTDGTDTNFVVQEDGKTGIGTATISNKLTVEPNDNDGILIDSNNDSRTGYLYFGDASSKTVGAVSYDHYSDSLRFNTAGSQRWAINAAGDLVSSGGAIDFGTTTSGSGTVTGGVLSDYEEGDWTPSVSVGSITGTGLTYVGKYTKIGRLVHIYIRVNATAHDINVASYVGFTGVPFSISTKASGTVIGEDIDVTAQQGFASLSGTTLFFGASGNSSAIGLTATLTGYI